jgi:hypothetical protein
MRRLLLAAVLSGAIMAQSPKLDTPNTARLKRMTARFAPIEVKVDTSALSAGDRKALSKLIEAANVIDDIFLTQRWSGNHALLTRLHEDHTPLGKARLDYFLLNKGPWSDLDGGTAFLPGVPPHVPPGANFYPPDMTRQEFESWVKTLSPVDRAKAEGFFTVIRRDPKGRLTMVSYSEAYKPDLERAAGLLREAAAATENESLKRFLTLRAEAFLSNDYYASDIAWMDLDAPLDVTIGPYETYNDEIFGYKAAFEAYITLRDERESAKLRFFAGHMQEVENNLPILPRYRNPRLGALAPISVVNEIRAAGDAAHGVRTAAFNLPNDERVVQEKGSKRVMLKNIQEAKFNTILLPIARRMLGKSAQGDLNFDAFFTHILAHEMSHGIGPHQIEVNGRSTTPRQELKELYSAIEEAKADVTGLFLLQFLYDNGLMPSAEKPLYTTFLASSFRTLRFGLKEAHGKGMALQFNYLADKAAFVEHADGTWAVDFSKIKPAVRDLDHELLTIEATGDYQRAKKMLDTLGVLRPSLEKALAALKAIPTDIAPSEPR